MSERTWLNAKHATEISSTVLLQVNLDCVHCINNVVVVGFGDLTWKKNDRYFAIGIVYAASGVQDITMEHHGSLWASVLMHVAVVILPSCYSRETVADAD